MLKHGCIIVCILHVHVVLVACHSWRRCGGGKNAEFLSSFLFSCSFSLPPANEVCEGYVFTGVCLSTGGGGVRGCSRGGMRGCLGGMRGCSGGHAWLLWGGMWLLRGGMHGCLGGHVWLLRGFAWLLQGGHVWLLWGGVCGCLGGYAWLLQGACMVAPGGCAWLLWGGHAWLLGGVHGCSEGGHAWLLGGACVVAPGGHAWLLMGVCVVALGVGACVVAPGGVCVVAWGVCMVSSMRYGQWAGGTHPTGMHYGYKECFVQLLHAIVVHAYIPFHLHTHTSRVESLSRLFETYFGNNTDFSKTSQ